MRNITLTRDQAAKLLLAVVGLCGAWYAMDNRLAKAEGRIESQERRVNEMRADVKEIRDDVKEILKEQKRR